MRRRTLRRFVAFAVLLAFDETSLVSARGADVALPGTYDQISPATQRVMGVGSEVVLQADRHGRIHFSLNAIRPSDKHLGYIGGTLPRAAGTAVWTNSEQDARCRLTFRFAHSMLQVTQDLRFGDCGFGYGVSGDGIYRRTRKTGKLGSWNGP